MKNEYAVALGKLGKGHKKRLEPEERERRRDWIKQVNARRMASKLDQHKALSDTCPASN